MAPRVDVIHPDPTEIARTLRSQHTSLQGARSFFAREGLIAYAEEKQGIAAEAEDLMMRPDAVRRMSNYLDMSVPSVAGVRIAQLPTQQLGLDGPKSAFERFRDRAERHVHVEATERVCLRCLTDSDDDAWSMRGVLVYETTFRLASGVRMPATADLVFYVRPAGDTALDVLLELARNDDHKAAMRWLRGTLDLHADGLHASEVVLVSDQYARHKAITDALDGFGHGASVLVSSPNTEPCRPSIEDEDSPNAAQFHEGLKRARYETRFYGLGIVIERAEKVDQGVLTGLSACCWRRGRGHHAALSVRLSQPGQQPLTLRWNSARRHTSTGERVELTEGNWERLEPVDWERSAKQQILRDLWGDVLTAIYGAQADASAGRSTAAA